MVSIATSPVHRVNVLAGVFGLGLAFYLAIEPTPLWLLLVLAALVGIGTDAIVRRHPASAVVGPTDTVVYLALPTLATVAAGISLERAVGGYWSLLAAAAVAAGFAALLHGWYLSLEAAAPAYATGRLVLNAASYLVVFAFYALAYEFDLGVEAGGFVVGLTSALVTLELLREGESDIRRLALYGGLVGLVMAQARWGLNFTPLDDFLAAATLLTAFYVLTALLQQHFARGLSWRTVDELSITAAVALSVIVIAHAFS